ncbi:MAG: cation transporter [Phycisphaerales bacterium]|nr:cation transporter [Phycisphaerales bacterium]
MKIRILYFAGCPNHPPVVAMAQRLVAEHRLSAQVEEVEVGPDEVEEYRFLGSPTVQVDGVDIEPAARDRIDFAMSCRVYDTPDGCPSESMLRAALGLGTAAGAQFGVPLSEGSGDAPIDRAGFAAIGGSVVTAALSSACCWLPLLLLAFGASSAGASALFDRWRGVFIAVAIVMLGLGFYSAYFRRTSCAKGCCATWPSRGRRLQRATLWASAVVVAAFLLFPNYVGLLLDAGAADTSSDVGADATEYVFMIEGMSCEACAVTLRHELAGVEGVIEAQVDYTTKTATIRTVDINTNDRVLSAASRLGYEATLRDR